MTHVHKGFSGQAFITTGVEPRRRIFQTGGTGRCSGEVFKSAASAFKSDSGERRHRDDP